MRTLVAALLALTLSASRADADFVVKRLYQGEIALPQLRGVAESVRGAEMDGDLSSAEALVLWFEVGESLGHIGIVRLATGEVQEIPGLANAPYYFYGLTPGNRVSPDYVDIDGDGLLDVLLCNNNQEWTLGTIAIGWSTGAGVEPMQGNTAPSRTGVPNPTASGATVRFSNPSMGSVDFTLFDVSGRLIRKFTTEQMQAGDCLLRWDGRDDAGRDAASGVYSYRIVAGTATETGRLVVTR